jgi:hypothetical protein
MSRDSCQLCPATSHLRVRVRPLISGKVETRPIPSRRGTLHGVTTASNLAIVPAQSLQ